MKLLKNVEDLKNLNSKEVICDIEVYRNYFLICFYFEKDKCGIAFTRDNFDRKLIAYILKNFTVITFNGNSYDIPIILFSLLMKVTEKSIFDLSSQLIFDDLRPYQIYNQIGKHRVDQFKPDHIDLIEVAFGKSSLKTYAGRLHSPYMQDLPYDPESELTDMQKQDVLKYCWNDCKNTALLRKQLDKQIELRIEMGRKYGCDLRSKSDAQIAEEVISRELNWKYNKQVKVPKYKVGYSFKYKTPEFIKFNDENLQKALKVIENADFVISESFKVNLPIEIKKLYIKINSSKYTIGIGGLHSNEQCKTHKSDDDYVICDRDVASYYPNIILNNNLYPRHMGREFLEIYGHIVATRLEAKAKGDKVTADSLKITINGSFGKFGSPYSILYAPELLIQTTITGQLCLLMLIDMLETKGFEVVSANTDGIVTKIKRERKNEFDEICSEWEKITRFDLEETEYSGLYSRDVNNYIAIGSNGKIKFKGFYKPSISGSGESESFELSKNPFGQIITEAVAEFLAKGTDVDNYIRTCSDVRKFVFVRNVKGGCIDKDGNDIGKVVRWYQAKGQFQCLKYKSNGNKVPNTDGAKPIMDLSVDFPQDIDYNYYSAQAKSIINSDFKKSEQLEFNLF